jgi:hypothetical protein
MSVFLTLSVDCVISGRSDFKIAANEVAIGMLEGKIESK